MIAFTAAAATYPWECFNPTALFAWVRYEVECDDFDRTLEGTEVRGTWVAFDRMTALSYARGRHVALNRLLRDRGVHTAESFEARRYVESLTIVEKRQLLGHLFPHVEAGR